MFNDPEWASKEEWDTYAWFGFAMQEAQTLEKMLLIIAVAFDMKNGVSSSKEDRWSALYDKFGRLTLGRLLSRVRKHTDFPESLADDLKKAVDIRNELAHAFFWPKNLKGEDPTVKTSQAKLMADASLFSNLNPRLEAIMWPLLDSLKVERSVAENQAVILIGKEEGIGTG